MIVDSILEALTTVFNKIPDGNLRAQIQADATKAIVEQEGNLLQAAKEIAVADSSSDSWLTKNARPLTVIWSLALITWLVLVAPIFGLTTLTIQAIQAVPPEFWFLVTAGIGAYPIVKTLENIFKGRK